MASAAAETRIGDDANWLKNAVGRHSFHPMADPKDTIANPPPIIMKGDASTSPTSTGGA